MSNGNTTIARRRSDGTLVEVMPDGSTKPLADKTDWQRLHGMADAEVEAAAFGDPDAQPLSDATLARMRRVPRVKTLRRALKLTQQEFAARYQIPLGTLRDWEEGKRKLDAPARAYLTVIEQDPNAVRRALEAAA